MNYSLTVVRDMLAIIFYSCLVVGCILVSFVLYRAHCESKGKSMRLTKFRLAVIVLTILTSLAIIGNIAGATTYKQTQKFSVKNNSYQLVPTAPFGIFGNAWLGDCQYETAANLTIAEWPTTKITLSNVVDAYNTYGTAFQGQDVTSDGGQNWTLVGLWAGQNYLINHGYNGHRASSITLLTSKYAEVQAANHGGMEVTATGPNLMHMFGIIQANAREVEVVDDGVIYHDTWAQLNTQYAYDGDSLTFYGVSWTH